MVGGHETTATTMQLAVVFLALNMQAQRAMQADIDRIVDSRPPAEWDFDADLPRLLEGWGGRGNERGAAAGAARAGDPQARRRPAHGGL